MSDTKDIFNQVFGNMDVLLNPNGTPPADHTTLSFWVLETYKEKFDELQDRTDKEFGKKLKELVYLAIDEAINR